MSSFNFKSEAEARETWWCPMVRVIYLPGGTITVDGEKKSVADIVVTNRGEAVARLGTKPIACNCIASDCALWIWADDITPEMSESEIRGRCGAARGCFI